MTEEPDSPKASRILLVDDDEGLRRSLSRGLRRAKMEVVTAADGSSAMSLLEGEEPFDLVVSDVRMPGVDGLTLLRFTRSLDLPPPFIVFSAYGSHELVAEAMDAGAEEFLEKPIDMRHLVACVREALAKSPHRRTELVEGFVAQGDWYRDFAKRLYRIARSEATVLIEGETGTGKGLVARALWRLSHRSKGSLVTVNCAAIPDHLLESELFGHLKGAFTGAINTRIGRIHQADGGVLFLDEVGELKRGLQAKLLHVIQERCIRPVGSSRDIAVDVRFIAATNRQLEQDVESGAFRRDLYYRLNVVRIEIPALRERPQDIPVLVEHFRGRWELINGRPASTFVPETIERLMAHDWPGNVRELENLVERAMVVLPPGIEIEPEMLERHELLAASGGQGSHHREVGTGPAVVDPEELVGRVSLADAVADFERRLIVRALERCDGNQSGAARLLGVNRTTLLAKLRKLRG